MKKLIYYFIIFLIYTAFLMAIGFLIWTYTDISHWLFILISITIGTFATLIKYLTE